MNDYEEKNLKDRKTTKNLQILKMLISNKNFISVEQNILSIKEIKKRNHNKCNGIKYS